MSTENTWRMGQIVPGWKLSGSEFKSTPMFNPRNLDLLTSLSITTELQNLLADSENEMSGSQYGSQKPHCKKLREGWGMQVRAWKVILPGYKMLHLAADGDTCF